MSVGGLGGILGGAAGTSLAQTKGSEAERAANETAAQKGKQANDKKADAASGIGETDGDSHESHDRDADGRRLWEHSPEAAEPSEEHADSAADAHAPVDRQSKDATGNCGGSLDLTG